MVHPMYRIGGDIPLRQLPEDSPERPWRRSPGRCWSPPLEIVYEGLDYERVEEEYAYPPNFNPNDNGPRIAKLNRLLLGCYRDLGKAFNALSLSKVVLEHNSNRGIAFWQEEDLVHSVEMKERAVGRIVYKARMFLGEVDAIGGSDAFYCPQEFIAKNLIGLPEVWRRVPSGTLAYLNNAPHYVAEVHTTEPENVYEGPYGRRNSLAKASFEKVAFIVNRIRYLQACNCKDKILRNLCLKLEKEVDGVINSAWNCTLTMPNHLRREVGYILSDVKEEEAVANLRRVQRWERLKLERERLNREQEKQWAKKSIFRDISDDDSEDELEEQQRRAEELAEEQQRRAEELAEEQQRRAEELAEEQQRRAEELAEEQQRRAEELAEEQQRRAEERRSAYVKFLEDRERENVVLQRKLDEQLERKLDELEKKEMKSLKRKNR